MRPDYNRSACTLREALAVCSICFQLVYGNQSRGGKTRPDPSRSGVAKRRVEI
jgi:hypothetical protein